MSASGADPIDELHRKLDLVAARLDIVMSRLDSMGVRFDGWVGELDAIRRELRRLKP
jgi:hypothetical protein